MRSFLFSSQKNKTKSYTRTAMKLASTNSVIISFRANAEWKQKKNDTKLAFCRAIFCVCIYVFAVYIRFAWQTIGSWACSRAQYPIHWVFFFHIPYLAYKLPENFLKFFFPPVYRLILFCTLSFFSIFAFIALEHRLRMLQGFQIQHSDRFEAYSWFKW